MKVETQACPKCGEWVEWQSVAGLGAKMMFFGLCFSWLPVIGWVMGPIVALLGVPVLIMGVLPQPCFDFKCGKCKKKWRLKRKEMVTV